MHFLTLILIDIHLYCTPGCWCTTSPPLSCPPSPPCQRPHPPHHTRAASSWVGETLHYPQSTSRENSCTCLSTTPSTPRCCCFSPPYRARCSTATWTPHWVPPSPTSPLTSHISGVRTGRLQVGHPQTK